MGMQKGSSLGREDIHISHQGNGEVSIEFKARYDLPSVSLKKIQVEEDHQILF